MMFGATPVDFHLPITNYVVGSSERPVIEYSLSPADVHQISKCSNSGPTLCDFDLMRADRRD